MLLVSLLLFSAIAMAAEGSPGQLPSADDIVVQDDDMR